MRLIEEIGMLRQEAEWGREDIGGPGKNSKRKDEIELNNEQ
jgi:hypothetical protein